MDDIADSNSAASPNSLKRKGDDSLHAPNPPTRSKRNRYTSIACSNCKKRKVKCKTQENGQNNGHNSAQRKCQRCENFFLECVYAPNCCGDSFKDSDEFKQMNAHIASLQGQVEMLFSNLDELRSTIPSQLYPQSHQDSVHVNSPPHSRSRSASKHPRFQGPTSSAFSLRVAKSSLQTMGITSPGDGDGAITQDETPMTSPRQQHKPLSIHPDKDPIYFVNKEEAIRLCHIYEEEMGVMYPVVDIDQILRHANLLFDFLGAATRSGIVQTSLHGADAISDDKTNMLKMVISLALMAEGSGQSPLGQRLYESVRASVLPLIFGSIDNIRGLRLITLCAMYHFQHDDESLSWRIIGLSSRLCMELGLHRHETYDTLFPNPSERASAVRLFWAIYILDKRWSFGTGMPYVIQDADIDPALEKPDDSLYLITMIAYGKIGSKVWRSVANVDNNRQDVNQEEIGYLDYKTIQWMRSIPEELRYLHPGTGKEPENVTRGTQRLRIVLYLRANQMRILIYRPTLQSATSIMQNRNHAQTVVDIAKDTQVLFNYFLISALAVIFLAVSHAPGLFSNHCRDEFYMVLELVRGFSATSYVAKRLWRTIRELKQFGPKLGLVLRQPAVDSADAHSTAAVAMAGLAGHQVDEMALYVNSENNMVNSPNGMANDLTNLFEAAGGFANLLGSGGSSSSINGYSVPQNGENGSTGFGTDEELSRIMKDLF